MSVVAPDETTVQTIRRILRRDLKLGEAVELPEDMPLVGGELDLDSLDVLLMLTSLEKEFGFKITSETIDRSAFATMRTLALYVDHRRQDAAGSPTAGTVDLPGLLSGLPHGEPFRFVTKLIDIKPGVEGRAVWQLSGQEPFFAGHFPGRPLVPGVLITEALAQLSGLVAAAGPGAVAEGRLASVNVRFREPVAPPARIELASRAAGAVGSLRQFEVEASVEGRTVAEGSLALSLELQTAK